MTFFGIWLDREEAMMVKKSGQRILEHFISFSLKCGHSTNQRIGLGMLFLKNG